MQTRYLSIGETANRLGVSISTLRRWEEKGVVSPIRTPGGERRYSTRELETLKGNPPQETLIDVDEAANLLGVSTKTVRRLVSRNKLNPQNGKFGKLLFNKLDVERLLKNNLPGNGQAIQAPAPPPSAPAGGGASSLPRFVLANAISVWLALMLTTATFAFVLSYPQVQQTVRQKAAELAAIFLREDVKLPDVNALLTNYLPLHGGTVEGHVVFTAGARFGPESLEVDETGIVTTSERIVINQRSASALTVAGGITAGSGKVGIIDQTGRIPALTEEFISSLDAAALTNINADKLDEFDSGDFLKSNQSDTAEGAINFTAKPGGNGVGGGPVYINPAGATAGYTLFGVAVGSSQRFKVDAEGDVFIEGDLQFIGAQTISTNTGNLTIDSAGSFVVADNTTLQGTLTVEGASTFASDISVSSGGQLSLTRNPTQAHTGTWAIGSATWNASDATIYVNPASPTTDSNIFALAKNGDVQFAVDAEGDVYANNLILAGNTTTGTTTVSGDLSVEGNTTLGDATTDTLTINPATLTWAGGNKTLDLTGAATRTLTLLNSTASQVLDLDLSDGSLKVGGTERITNAGAGTLTSLNLSDTSNQLVLQSAGVTGTISWTPATTNKTLTIPNITGTVITTGDTGTVTNTMLAGSIAASKLVGTDIATIGTITTGVWNGTAIIDTYVADTLTIDSSSSVTWTALTSYPTACASGEAVSAVGDTLTCITAGLFTDGGTTTYLTSTTDDLALGGTDSTAPFFMDVSAGDLTITGDMIVGASTSSTETLANAGFTLGGDDLFVAGTAGIEGNVYTDGSFITGATTTYADGSVTFSSTTPSVVIGDTGTISVTDGTNTLAQIVDNGTTGNFQVSGVYTAISGNNLRLQASGTGTGSSGSANIFFLDSDGSTQGRFETAGTGILPEGDGADGAITVSVNKNINTDTLAAGRSCADGGDAVNYSVTANVAAAATSITLSTTPSAGCLAVGDEILIINLQGTSGDNANVGKYETRSISAISGAILTVKALTNGYDGTTQKIMVQRVPNYTSVTINSGITLTANAWDGTKGGVLFFRANGAVTVTGTISMASNGFRGGTTTLTPENGTGRPAGSGGGNGGTGGGRDDAGTNPSLHNGGNGTNGAGGGGGGDTASGGSPIPSGGTTGGGTGCSWYVSCSPTAGTAGTGGGGGSRGWSGGGGGGAKPFSSLSNSTPTSFATVYLGGGSATGGGGGATGSSGGAAGGQASGAESAGSTAGNAGNPGGGIIIIKANSVTVTGSFTANGGSGGTGGTGAVGNDICCGGGSGGGGGGFGSDGAAGGSVLIHAPTVNLSASTVSAAGGSGGSTGSGGAGGSNGAGAGGSGGAGSAGGAGVTRIVYTTNNGSLTHSPTPTTSTTLDAIGYGTLHLQTTNTSAADIAEYYVTGDKSIEAGDVVVMERVLFKSSKPYERSLIGVISTNPGVVLGSIDGDTGKADKRILALAGRVPVKIWKGSKPIAVGDFITSSSESGLGMKATRPGYVVGRALESWTPASGKDRIEVFVSLSYYMGSLADSSTLSYEEEKTATQSPAKQADLALQQDLEPQATESAALNDTITNNSVTNNDEPNYTLLPEHIQVDYGTFYKDLSVIGKTTLGETAVTGKLSVGLLTIDGLPTSDSTSDESKPTSEVSLNALGTLKLQNALGGGVEIDEMGNVKVNGTLTAEAIEAQEIKGGIMLANQGERPACDETSRGKIWFNKNEAGDIAEICIKDPTGTLHWKEI